MAYDYGVRSAWIVNVGDIKNQELPLSYFIDLAYDFDKWGTNAINKTKEYTKLWLEKNGFEKDIAKEGAELITEYVSLNGKRRPEALKSTTYHASHENEAKNMLAEIEKMLRRTEALYEKVKGSDLEECFFQLIFYPVNAVALINKMHLFGSLNDLYIRQRRKTANVYAKLIQKCIEREQKLTEEYHTRNNGKWNHMQSVYHIGFTNWNDEQCEYPISSFYNPVKDSRLLVSLSNREDWTGAHRWTRHVLNMPLCFDTNASGVFEVSNGGEKLLMYRIDWDVEWLEIKNLNDGSKVEKNSQLKVDDTCSFEIRILKDKWDGTEKSMVRIYGDDCEIVADESENSTSVTMVELMVEATALNLSGVDKECFLETDGCISIEAVNYQDCKATKAGEYKAIDDYGRTAGGMKVYPQTIRFENTMDAPELGYNVFAVSDGDYICDIYTSASNPVVYKGKMEIGVKANDGNAINVNTIPDVDFVPWKSESWSEGVLDQIHISECKLSLHQGLNTIKIFAIDPAVVIEKIVLWNPNTGKRKSYLGPVESKIYKV